LRKLADQETGLALQGGTSELLERSEDLSLLQAALAAVGPRAGGKLVLVSGEAGVGKTALLRHFCAEQRPAPRILWGSCDALLTPRPLGPLLDIAESAGGELQELVGGGARPYQVVSALMRELGGRDATIVVLEDMHWADEATLDAMRVLGRRIGTAPALVLASYRDDELDRFHPLRIVIGELGGGATIERLRVDPLSVAAVSDLAGMQTRDPRALHRITGGNPFFVTEVLAAGTEALPESVRDAVLARAARLSPRARELLESVGVVPRQAELWLLEALAGEGVDFLEECVGSGMLTSEPSGVGFRHELARIAIEQSLPADRGSALHRAALAALLAPPTGAHDLERIAHHAEAAADQQAVLRFAPAAGDRAATLGAHREAAAQYARARRFAAGIGLRERAQLLDRRARECSLIGELTEAIELRKQAIECHRRLGDARREGNSLRALSWPLWVSNRMEEAERASLRAVTVLETLPPGVELARAYAAQSLLCMGAEDLEETVAWGTRALELAQRLDHLETRVNALETIGTVEYLRGADAGREKLEQSLELAREAGLESQAAGALDALARGALRSKAHARARGYLDAAIEYCSERDLDGYRPELIGMLARLQLEQGRWEDAADSVALVLRLGGLGHATLAALVVLGRLRARRGDPEVWPPLDEALALAVPSGELERLALVAAARAEAAWLEGRRETVAATTEDAFQLAQLRRIPWVIGELAYWRRRAGVRDALPPDLAEPYALQLAGDWARAAECWRQLGCPYEAALRARRRRRGGAAAPGARRAAGARRRPGGRHRRP
jgi:tetratricopeptide (TPR) repeat protein